MIYIHSPIGILPEPIKGLKENDSLREKKGKLSALLDTLRAKKQALYEGYKLERISREDYEERVSILREETVKLKEWIEQMCLTEQKEKERVGGAWAAEAEGLTRELVDR